MQTVLYLTHRIPYPPDKGDKIRSYHILKYLSQHYRVIHASFVDDPRDKQFIPEVEKFCHASFCLPIKASWQKLKALKGLMSNTALSVEFYQHRKMQDWLKKQAALTPFDKVYTFSSSMAPYALAFTDLPRQRIMDFVDLDSQKWQQYANHSKGIMRWLFQREANLLKQHEKKLAGKFKHCLFVSPQECDEFSSWFTTSDTNIHALKNGVDCDYFNPNKTHCQRPFSKPFKTIVFTGAMDYWANVHAVSWFTENIFSKLQQIDSTIQFYIVGSNPTPAVQQLAKNKNIFVTGRVEDVRPYLQHANCIVAPMQIARGIQNKVLEAMAMEKPVFMTHAASTGLCLSETFQGWITDHPEQMAHNINLALNDNQSMMQAKQARNWVMSHFSWTQVLAPLQQLLSESQ